MSRCPSCGMLNIINLESGARPINNELNYCEHLLVYSSRCVFIFDLQQTWLQSPFRDRMTAQDSDR